MNMLQFVPNGLSTNKNGGLYAATIAGLWSPEIGHVVCTAVAGESLALQGKFRFLGKESPFAVSITLTGDSRANVSIEGIGAMCCAVRQDGNALLYEVLDGGFTGATIKQTYKEQDASSGAYVQFDIQSDELQAHTGTGFLAAKCWFHRW